MKRFYCVILAMLAVVLYAIVMSGCRAISSNVEVATQPVVETPLAEHIGKVRQGPFVNDAEEFVRNISVLLEEKSPHDYSVRRIEEILLNNGYLEEYFKGNTEPLALYCFEYIINHESLCYVSDNQNVSFSGNDKAIALIAWELMLTYDDTDLNYITSASSLENWLYFLRTGAPVNFILAESNIDDTYYTTHPIEKQYIVAMPVNPLHQHLWNNIFLLERGPTICIHERASKYKWIYRQIPANNGKPQFRFIVFNGPAPPCNFAW